MNGITDRLLSRRTVLRAGAGMGLVLAAPMHFVRGAFAEDMSCNLPTGSTVTFGFNVPQSGPYADEGADELRAYQLAVKHLNGEGDGGALSTFSSKALKGNGVLGKKVVFVTGDTQTKSDAARDSAKRMIEKDKAIMVTGGSSSGEAIAVQSLCNDMGVIFMACLTHSNDTTGKDKRRYGFRHFFKRTHADQILMTFGLAIVVQEIIKKFFGANPIPQAAPSAYAGTAQVGHLLGLGESIPYPAWRMVYLAFALIVIAAVFAFLQFTTYGMVVRAGMRDRETVGLLGINIERRFTMVFGLAAVVAGLAGVMYTPILPPDYHMGMDFLVLSFVVVVVGGMGSLPGAVAAGFLLGILQSFASMNEVKNIIPGIDQIIIYLVAVVILLARPRGLFGRKGVMEE